MRFNRLFVTALSLTLPVAACSSNASAGDRVAGTTQSFQIANFSGVALQGSDDVDVRVGTGFSVRAEGPAAELAQLRIVRDGDTLRIDRKPRTGFGWTSSRGVKVFVTMPRIIAAEVRGSGDMAIDRVEGSRFAAAAVGSGNLRIAAITTGQATLAARGSGDLTAAGAVDQLTAAVTGSGAINAPGLKARSAVVALRGSGDLRATVTGTATVALSGSGDIDLGRQARCTISKSGSGDVRCGG
ncbi:MULTISPECIES: head GIN domain-containing protein [unclassified Sphingomonas]|uniref:head GIN domain-containing protein n=1 Tax=unclassified Sphingomonas TaxID=196159 RepID=UPI001F568FBF|nr:MULTISPECIES: head GIN domain-containing protein [unclassified Sphingomonas]